MTKYCITNDDAILKVKSVKNGLVDVSDPDAIDAGQFIPTKDVRMYWIGHRPKDKLPENGQEVSIFTSANCCCNTVFEDGRFEYDRQCEENVSIAGIGTPDRVILWGEPDSVF